MIQMIRLSLRMVPFVSGFVHVQVNPLHSYSTTKVVANAQSKLRITQTSKDSIYTDILIRVDRDLQARRC